MDKDSVLVLGGGLVGSLLSIFLAKRGMEVAVYEKRPDPRKNDVAGGRSINLALSDRGLLALQKAGITKPIDELVIPMKGRMIHHQDSSLGFQPYGKSNQAINSVSRGLLNELLVDEAERTGVRFYFSHKCVDVDVDHTLATFETGQGHETVTAGAIIGADGAFSSLRSAMQHTDRFNYSQEYIEHSYKELVIPDDGGRFQIEPNALHIWPRGQLMLIALPNIDGSFTCTLFLPFEGRQSFAELDSEPKVRAFFASLFPDTQMLIPDLIEQFFANPTSSLITVRCFPWSRNNCLLIGDAAHAILPFYGQGMNAGFEDCRLLDEMMEGAEDWKSVFGAFEKFRKPDTDAMAQLAFDNFIEMRDKVGDERFLWQKKLEARLHEAFPSRWIPLYTMVTFSGLRYSEALKTGQRQEAIMNKIMKVCTMSTAPEDIDLEKIVTMLD